MALGNKRTPRKLIKDRTGDGIINETRLNRVSSSLASEIFTDDPAVIDGPIAPVLYHTDLIQEDIDELRRHITEDRTVTDNNYTTAEKSKLAGIEAGADVTDTTNVVNALTAGTNITIASNGTISSTASGGGGGLRETPLAMISARWMWSNTDSGERVFSGTTSYGPFGYFSFAAEPWNSTLRTYDSRQVVDTATSTAYAYEMPFYGVWCPDNGKKVKAKFSFRVQNSPAATGSTWGISLWSASDQNNGTTTSDGASTVTLRAKSPDISVTTRSNTYWTTTCTTTSNMNDVWILPLLENRSGTLTTTTYVFGQIALYLV